MELIFEKPAAQWVRERRWHATQKITPLKGGRIRMELRVAVCPELIAWVLGFGAQARVVRPERLLKAVQNEAWELLGKYQKIKIRCAAAAGIGGSGKRTSGGA